MAATETLVIAAHGSLADARAATPAYAHADRLRARGGFNAVRVAFWKEEPGLRTVVRSLEDGAATVVPLLSSSGYFANEVFPAELGVLEGGAGGATLRYADPVGTHPALSDVVADRVAAASDDRGGTTVVVVGHGTGRNPRSGVSTRRHARRLRDRGTYPAVRAAFLDDEPNVADVLDHIPTSDVVIVPLFVADGPHVAEDVPAALGHPGIGRTATIDDHAVHYTGAVGTEPSLADVILKRALEAGAVVDRTPDGLVGAERRLSERFETGNAPTTWGELRVRREPDGYALCHAADVDRPRTDLSPIRRRASLRVQLRRDDRGRYRPLTGERTLPRGWIAATLDTAELVRGLETVYPGAVFTWDRDHRDALDPTRLGDTVDRQRGMYAELSALKADDRRAAAAAVCGNCVRDRRWTVAREAATADDGRIPCEEACPFFLAAAHGLAAYGPEAAETADSGVHASAFDDPANRFRVRYARFREESDVAPPVVGGDR